MHVGRPDTPEAAVAKHRLVLEEESFLEPVRGDPSRVYRNSVADTLTAANDRLARPCTKMPDMYCAGRNNSPLCTPQSGVKQANPRTSGPGGNAHFLAVWTPNRMGFAHAHAQVTLEARRTTY